jgi:ribosome-associated protein
MEFSLKGMEFIELNKLLKFLNIAESGGFANKMILNGDVLLNKKIETRKRCKLRPGDIVLIKKEELSILIKE